MSRKTSIVISTVLGLIILLCLKSGIVFGLLCLLMWLISKAVPSVEFTLTWPFIGLVAWWIINLLFPSKGGDSK